MTKSRTERMVSRLHELRQDTSAIESSAVVSVDGLIIASALPPGVEEDRVSAMSAAMLSLGERIANELGRGMLEEVYIQGDQGYVFLRNVGVDAVLTVMTRSDANIGAVRLYMKRAVGDLAQLL
ncbi:MAG: hypothetical protein GY832_21610 [Chloroflexi bacterium]|nr:hypothetical protein [Chloroflexota bacterium]